MDSRSYWVGFIWITGLMLLSGFLKSWAANGFGKLIDAGVAGMVSQVRYWGVLVLCFLLLDAVRLIIFNNETIRIVNSMFLDVKEHFSEVVARSCMAEFEKVVRAGDVVSRVTSDLSTLQGLFSDTFAWLINVYFRGIIALIFCLGISWQLSLIYVILLPISIILMNRIGKNIQKYKKLSAVSGGHAYSLMYEIIRNLATIKVFNAEDTLKQRYDDVIDTNTDQLIDGEKHAMTLSLISYLGNVVQLGLIFFVGILLINRQIISIGELAAFIAIAGNVREALELTERGISAIRESEVLAERIYEIIDIPVEMDEGEEASGEPFIKFENLSFGYENDAVLKDISLHLGNGDKIAIIGSSGCGKSTIVKLICKLYDGYIGNMILLGREGAQIKKSSLRQRIALVSQDSYLFNGSIADNMRYGRENATNEQIENVLRAVRLWDFVSSLPKGMDEPIGDYGSRLSGGQKQRLAIARALLRDVELIILDEATSALDTQTELDVLDTIAQVFSNKAVIVIAHRFAALRDVEYVYCLEDGRIIEYGKKDELLKTDGYIRRISKAQETR